MSRVARSFAAAAMAAILATAAADLARAAEYHDSLRREGLIALEGPAAPRNYELAHRFLGFAAAERLATLFRS